ncbi:amino acid adenylation domain-containing protein [uncultured Pluralibacter sp.]|uniref:amino acid adenylation domain-containing protein n=1 Tax=uncultured Pluralibacter sp. TaxID=1490864 RepID=UPI0026128139|nr:amino acid adenylation domain-containing protein [uncultured Pluralibacter sp.]
MELPLTPLQQAYLLGRGDSWPLGGVAMHDFREYRAFGLDLNHLRTRLAELIGHYPALRTCIDTSRGTRRVCPEVELNLDHHDLRALSEDDATREIQALRERHSHNLHDPARPPWRIVVIQFAGRTDPPAPAYDTLIFTSFDALILDGSGISFLIARLFDQSPLLPALPDPTAFAPEVAHTRRQADAAWWRARLQDAVIPPALPWHTPLAAISASRYRRACLTLPRDMLKQLGRLGSPHALLRNTLLSTLILDTLLHWTSDGGLCVGVPVAFPSASGELGNASTFMALRYPRGGEDFLSRARALQEDVLSGLDHLAFSGVDLSRQLLKQSQGGPALPVILTNCLGWETLPADAPVRYSGGLTQTPQVAIDIRLMFDSEKNIQIAIDYAVQALSPEIIDAVLAALQRRVVRCCQQQSLSITPAEFIDLSHYRHNTERAEIAATPWLAELAGRLFDPGNGATALICDNQKLTYSELGQRVATAIAQLQQRGMGPGRIAALYLPRGPERVILSLACALQGIIWVPLDIGSPPERIAGLLENCSPDLVVHGGGLAATNGLAADALLLPTEAPPQLPDEQTLARRSAGESASYYLYTSGTTGSPKCVVLNNRATGNVIHQTRQRWAVTPEDVFISVTPPHHDMAMFDLFGALSAGATLVLPAPHEEKDAIAWNRLVQRHRVSLWCSVPAILEMLLACKTADSLRSLRLVAMGGDFIKPDIVQTLRALDPPPTLFSLGGPTETTIWSIWHPVAAEDTRAVPYGRPLAGNGYFICRDDGSHCPTGVTGRIHTAGVNLALGYLERGELKQHDFITLADASGEPLRAFRTGDRGYYRPDGSIMFAARINGYVKIRGARVSLPEIEGVLRQHPAIADIAVVDYVDSQNGETALGALYSTFDRRPVPRATLHAFAARALPGGHIPGRFIHAANLPLSANGKIDRQQIRNLLGTRPAAAEAPTRSAAIVAIYCRAIGVAPREEWGAETAFIAMGLKLPHVKQAAGQLNAAFGSRLEAGLLLRCRNAREVEALLDEQAG